MKGHPTKEHQLTQTGDKLDAVLTSIFAPASSSFQRKDAMNILTIEEKIENGETVTIPTQCLGEVMCEVERRDLNLSWHIAVKGAVTKLSQSH